MYQIRNLC